VHTHPSYTLTSGQPNTNERHNLAVDQKREGKRGKKKKRGVVYRQSWKCGNLKGLVYKNRFNEKEGGEKKERGRKDSHIKLAPLLSL